MRQLAMAESALRAGDLATSTRLAEAVATQAPGAVAAWHLWAVSLAQGGMHQAACVPFRRAMELAPDDVHLLANFATALRRIDRLDEAVSLWRRAVGLAPTFGQAWLDLGLTELDRRQFAEAGDAFKRAIVLMPTSITAWHGLASTLDAQHRTGEAEQALRSALACGPHQPAVLIHLGHVLRRQARLDEALACYAQARQVGADTPELLDAQAGALLDAGQIDAAIATARQLTARHPRFVPGQRTLASILWEYGQGPGQAHNPLASFASAVSTYPDDTELRFAYAGLLKQTDQGEAALEHIAQLRQHDDHPSLRRFEADTLESLGRSEHAGRIYDELYRQHGLHVPGFLNAYARHLLKTGQWRAAAARAGEVLAQEPHNQEAWAYLATAWRLLGDPREFWLCDYDRLITMVDIDVPAGHADIPQFLSALKTALLPLHRASREPVQQTLRQGTQTPGNLFGRPEPAIQTIERSICAAAEHWLGSLPADDSHPFLGRKARRLDMQGAWSVKLRSTGYHVNHIHHQGLVSSAFYVALPPVMQGAQDDAGSIQFGQPPSELGLQLPPRRVLRPRPGSLALFPSYMWHGTLPFQDDAFRLTVACDMTAAD